jgi:beta-catenin-like protein 1
VLKRVIGKFSENDYEKVDRLLELREKYSNSVDAAAAEHQKDHEGEEEEEEDADEKYLARLEAGLFKVQMTDLIAASIAANPFSDAVRKIRQEPTGTA